MPGVLDDANEDDRREAFENLRRRRRDLRGEHKRQRNDHHSHQSRSANDSEGIPGQSHQSSQRKGPMEDPPMGGNPPKSSSESSPPPQTPHGHDPEPSSSRERPPREVPEGGSLAAQVKTLVKDLENVIKGFLEELSAALKTLATSAWNGLKLAILFFRIVKCLTPSMIIQAVLTALFSAAFILVGLAVILNTLINGFGSTCNKWNSHAPAILTPFPGCDQMAPPARGQGFSGEDTLDGFTPRVSPPLSFLVHSLDNTNEKVSELTDSWSSNPETWIKDLKEGVSQAESSEKDFAQGLEQSWESVNSYIRRFRQAGEPPVWWGAIIETLGFSNKAQAKVVQTQNLQLQGILSHSLNRTQTAINSLALPKKSGIFDKSLDRGMESYGQLIQEALTQKDARETSLQETYYSFTVSSSSAKYYKSLLSDRDRRLRDDDNWLQAKLYSLESDRVALGNGPGKMTKDEWTGVLNEMETRILNTAIEWRKRLKGHFVESHGG